MRTREGELADLRDGVAIQVAPNIPSVAVGVVGTRTTPHVEATFVRDVRRRRRLRELRPLLQSQRSQGKGGDRNRDEDLLLKMAMLLNMQ
eukprot:14329444-Heterocapsa_arctica.AAC.1